MLLLQLIINGLESAANYALVALGFAVIYNFARTFHIAHGAVYTLAGYTTYLLIAWWSLPLPLALVASVAVATVVGILMEVLLYRELRRRGAGQAGVLIASIGLLTVLESLIALTLGTENRSPRSGALPQLTLGELSITSLHVGLVVVAALAFLGLQLFLSRTTYGTAIRALADNPRLARVLGIDIDRLYLLAFGIGSALAGLAAGFITLDIGVHPFMGLQVIFIAIIAVLIGGFGYLPGCVAGALILGLLQQLASWRINTSWQDTVVYGTLLFFLFFLPYGLFGGRLRIRRA